LKGREYHTPKCFVLNIFSWHHLSQRGPYRKRKEEKVKTSSRPPRLLWSLDQTARELSNALCPTEAQTTAMDR